MKHIIICISLVVLTAQTETIAQNREFAGIVSSASPEATNVGVEILENVRNAYDAAIAVSPALSTSTPAGSGIFGQTQPTDRNSLAKAA